MIVQALISVGVLRLAALALAVAFLVMVTAAVPPEVYGQFNLVLSVVQVICAAILAWPNQAALRFGRQAYVASGSLEGVLGGRLIIHMALLAPLVVAVPACAAWSAGWVGVDAWVLMIFSVVALVVLPLPDMALATAQACGRFRAYGVAPVLQRGMQVAAVGAIWLGVDPSWQVLMAATLAGYAVSALVAWADIPKSAIRLQLEPGTIRRMVAYGWTIPLGTLAAFLLMWMDIWFIRAFLDQRAVGLYSWAFTMVLLGTSLLVPLAAVVAPRAIDCRVSGDTVGLARLNRVVSSTCLLVAALLPVAVSVVAAFAVSVGLRAYEPALVPLLVLAVAVLYQMGTALMEPVVYAQEKLVPRMVLTALAMAAGKAVADFVMVPELGILGAALATVAAQAFGLELQRRWVCAGLAGVPSSALPLVLAGLPTLGLALMVDQLPVPALVPLGIGLSAAMVVAGRRLCWFGGMRAVLPNRGMAAFLAKWLAPEHC